MTESQRENELLNDLLADAPAQNTSATYQPPLTRGDEQRLLHEANEVGTPTLLPADTTMTGATANEDTFVGELVDFVRRHPVPTLLAAVGAAYLLTRRSSR